MSLVNTLKQLKTNIFGGPGNTGFEKPPAYKTRINLDTPTGILDHDPFQFGTYQYPLDMIEGGQLGHYMVFYVNVVDSTKFKYENQNQAEYDYAKSVRLNKALEGTADYQGDFVNIEGETMATKNYVKSRAKKQGKTDKNLDNEDNSLLASTRNKDLRTGVATVARQAGTTRRITDSVALYLPPNVQDNTSAAYEDTPTGVLGLGAKAGLGFIDAFAAKDYDAAARIFAESGGVFAAEVAKRAGAALAEGAAGAEGALGLFNRVFGRADNPFMEVLFTSMNIRTFTYNFNFAPRNEDETAEVQKIIQLFRYHMAPELQGANSRYLTLPSEFDIHYMYHGADGTSYENDYFNRIATCVLENVAVNYTPGDKVRTFQDGAPTQITMGLTFRETELLTKERINQGY
tara:strand:+ start:42 stop:1250 length:1209 start_codon:yes stop_codon:yes gene_type:complete